MPRPGTRDSVGAFCLRSGTSLLLLEGEGWGVVAAGVGSSRHRQSPYLCRCTPLREVPLADLQPLYTRLVRQFVRISRGSPSNPTWTASRADVLSDRRARCYASRHPTLKRSGGI